MRREDTLELDTENGKLTITVREFTVNQVLKIYEGWKKADDGTGVEAIKDDLENLFKLSIVGATFEDLKELAPSELKEIYDKFKEVNSVFFGWADSMGVKGVLEELASGIRNDFLKPFVASLKGDIETS